MTTLEQEALFAAREAARTGQPFALYGLTGFTLDAIDRAIRLHRRFGWEPMDYLVRWGIFQKEKADAQVK